MENTDRIKDMITLIEKNNENYHDALSNLADTLKKSISDSLRNTRTPERPGRETADTGAKQRTGLKNPVTSIYRLFSRKR